MPVLDGPSTIIKILAAIKKLQDSDAKKVRKPFICCLTAFGDEAHINSETKAGMDLVIVKPLYESSLKSILKKSGIL